MSDQPKNKVVLKAGIVVLVEERTGRDDDVFVTEVGRQQNPELRDEEGEFYVRKEHPVFGNGDVTGTQEMALRQLDYPFDAACRAFFRLVGAVPDTIHEFPGFSGCEVEVLA